jgi:PKD domain
MSRCAGAAVCAALFLFAATAPSSATVTTIASNLPVTEGIDLDSAGNIFVAHRDNVVKYGPDGAVLATYGSRGAEPGQFHDAFDVALDSQDNFYVVEHGGPGGISRLQKFDATGSFVWSSPVPFQSTLRIAIDTQDRLWAAELNNRRVKRYSTADGSVLADWPAGEPAEGGPTEVAFDPAGNLWAFIWAARRLDRYTPEGVLLGASADTPPSDGGGNTFLGNATDGSLLAGGPGGIRRYTGDAEPLSTWDALPYEPGAAGVNITSVVEREQVVYASATVIPAAGCGCTYKLYRIDRRVPTVGLTAAPDPPLTGQTVTFDASASEAHLTQIARFEWDLDGDSNFETDSGTTPVVSVAYSGVGQHTVRVRVSTALGGSAIAETTFAVHAAPPAGAVGVSINAGSQFTNDPNVTVAAVWPPHVTTLAIANDGGFAAAQTFPVSAETPWTLASSGPERLPKTIYVRFDDSTQTYQDDIILDQTAPVVESVAVVSPAASVGVVRRRTYRLRTKANDRVSGLSRLQFARRRGSPSRPRRFRRRTSVRATSPPRFARVRDRAGNWSRWKRVER